MYAVLVLSLLIAMIVLVAIGKPERHWIGIGIVLVLLVSGAIGFNELVEYVHWDVLGLILGMSIFSILLEKSGIADVVSRYLLRKVRSPFKLFFVLVFLSGVISIALENVTVVLLFAPIVFKISRISGSNPVPLMIGVALASNMAGSATMIGDPPAIITAGHYDLNFLDFIIYDGKPSMFFITLIPMLFSCLTYSFFSLRTQSGRDWSLDGVINEDLMKGVDKTFMYETLFFLSVKIVLLSIRDIYHIPLTLAAIIGVGGLASVRIILHGDYENVKTSIVEGFEWKLLVFLIGVFALSGSFAKYGLASAFAKALLGIAGSNIYVITGILIWLSVAISAVIDNTPYVVTMLPVIDDIAASTGVNPIVYAWSLLLGATLGGGITYIGASANLVAVRLLEKRGYRITFGGFIRYSIPFNIVNIMTGWLLFIVFWLGLG